MKKIISATLVGLLPSVLWAQSGSYTVQGQLDGVKAPAKAYLRYGAGTALKLDSTTIQNGKFAFKGSVDSPIKGTLLVDKRGTGLSKTRPTPSISLYLEPGTVKVSSPDSLKNAVVSGTPLNVDNQKLDVALKPSLDKMDALMQEYRAATPEQRSKKEFSDALDKRYEAIEAEQKMVYAQFIKSMPQSLVALDALKSFGGYAPEYGEVRPVFDGLSDDVKNSKAGQEYAATLNRIKATSVGEQAPDFTQADTLGKAISLHDFKGKYVLVDFWASWCGPCRAENPNLLKAYNTFKSKDFTIVGISLDSDAGKWKKAIKEDKLPWTQLSDLKGRENAIAQYYNVRGIPWNILVDRDGKIVAKDLRGSELEKKLLEMIK